LKESDIRFTTFSAIILIALIPALLLYWILTVDSSRELQLRDKSYLSDFRDEKIQSLQADFSYLTELIDKTSTNTIINIMERKNLDIYETQFNRIFTINKSILSIYFFDRNRKPLFLPENDPYYRTVTDNISERLFSEPTAVDFLSFPDNQSLLCIYQKHVTEGGLKGYSAILLDFSFISPHLNVPDTVELDIYNEEYQLVGTSAQKQLGVVTINDLTRTMIDGYSDFMELEDNIHSFGYINLGETSLYLTIYKDLKYYGKQSSSGSFSLLFFILILLFSSYLTAWKMHKEILKYGERILVRRSYTKDMRFFSRLKGNLLNLSKNTAVFEQIENQLKYMENDIDYIIDNIPESGDEEGK